jgi:hypothetical protein
MIKEEQLVFFIGIPGSGWAKIDSLLRCCSRFKLNKSDYSEHRRETIWTKYYIDHKGHFLGPGMEFGEGFNDIEKNYTKDEFIEECLKSYSNINNEDNYLIKCHWFAEIHNLKWLRKNFPKNKIIFVLRDLELCNDRWISSMTFTKNYPKYTAWMENIEDEDDPKNIEKFKSLNHHHNNSIRKFLSTSLTPYVIFCPSKYILDNFGFIWNEEGKNEYRAYIENYANYIDELNIIPAFDTQIVLFNCEDWFRII